MSENYDPVHAATGLVGWHLIAASHLPDRWQLEQDLDAMRADWYANRSRRSRKRLWRRLCELQPALVELNPDDLSLSQDRDDDVAAIAALIAAARTEPEAATALVVSTSGYWISCARDWPSIDVGAICASIRSLPAATPALMRAPLFVILRQAVREADETAFRPLIRVKELPSRVNRPRIPDGLCPSWIASSAEFAADSDVEAQALIALAGADMLASAGHLLNPKRRRELAILVGRSTPNGAAAPPNAETRRRHRVQQTAMIARKHGLERTA